jgi:hypothetical protein
MHSTRKVVLATVLAAGLLAVPALVQAQAQEQVPSRPVSGPYETPPPEGVQAAPPATAPPPAAQQAPAPGGVVPGPANVTCTMTYHLSGWSVFFKKANGTGQVTCSNGQSAAVRIRVAGGGLSFGKSDVNGTGKFSGVRSINDIFGKYGTSAAHAGVGASAEAQGMTKGNVNLGLTATGQGVDVGVYFGKFIIEPFVK